MKRKKNATGMIVVTIVIILAALVTYQAYRATIEDPLKSTVAQCLTQNGVVMYGVDTCPACVQQKAVFGTSWKHIVYLECDKTDACRQAGIESTPTWAYGEERLVGLQQLGQLAQWGNCTSVLEG